MTAAYPSQRYDWLKNNIKLQTKYFHTLTDESTQVPIAIRIPGYNNWVLLSFLRDTGVRDNDHIWGRYPTNDWTPLTSRTQTASPGGDWVGYGCHWLYCDQLLRAGSHTPGFLGAQNDAMDESHGRMRARRLVPFRICSQIRWSVY
jgi:hypothetical protein